MPIKPENKGRYPKDWKQISLRIRERDGNCCKFCGLANGSEGWRVADGTFYTAEQFSNDWIDPKHEDQLCEAVGKGGPVKIVLTVAHLDHQPENCADDNLAALCQRCHNRYDQAHRKANARKTRDSKKGQLTLGDLFTL